MSLPVETKRNLRRRLGESEAKYAALEAKYAELEQLVAKLTTLVNAYEEQIRLAEHKRHAPSSEHTPVEQQSLFNEAETLADPDVPEPETETITVTRCKKPIGHREAQLAHLDIHEIEHPLFEDKQFCGCCGEK